MTTNIVIAMIMAVPVLAGNANPAALKIPAHMSFGVALFSLATVITHKEVSGYEITVLPDFPGDRRRMPVQFLSDGLERLMRANTDFNNQTIRQIKISIIKVLHVDSL